MKYYVSACWYHIEEDTYEDGCIGGFEYQGRKGYSDHGTMDYIEGNTYDSLTAIMKDIAEHWGTEYTPNCCDIDDWDGETPGRIDLGFEVSTPEGYTPTEKEWEEFRAGKRSLYYLGVSFMVEYVSPPTHEELKEAYKKETDALTAN